MTRLPTPPQYPEGPLERPCVVVARSVEAADTWLRRYGLTARSPGIHIATPARPRGALRGLPRGLPAYRPDFDAYLGLEREWELDFARLHYLPTPEATS